MGKTNNKTGSAAIFLAALIMLGASPAAAQTVTAEDTTNSSKTNMVRTFVDGIFINNDLKLEVQGQISTGDNVVITVLHNNAPVEAANVWFNGNEIGLTDSNGQIEATVPESTVLRVKANKDDFNGYLRRKIS